MTCLELRESLAEHEDGSRPEQRAHLKNCPECAALVADLLVIACAAGELRAEHEPSPRVWNSIEIALRKEGLIRPQKSGHSLLPAFGSSWGWARWLAPAAALFLITAGIFVRQHTNTQTGRVEKGPATTAALSSEAAIEGLNDADLLEAIAQQTPALKAEYTENLQRVNQYIEDAKNDVDAYPNDEEARRSLMAAYQEKAMLFELALDRSLP
ncbi:MAG TPA: hypothetical protein VMP68_29910 [Candidatus Eisenbacteria bacterium]|nr:hypothetical protein [Candidatus Eisenbacteria bacterium]